MYSLWARPKAITKSGFNYTNELNKCKLLINSISLNSLKQYHNNCFSKKHVVVVVVVVVVVDYLFETFCNIFCYDFHYHLQYDYNLCQWRIYRLLKLELGQFFVSRFLNRDIRGTLGFYCCLGSECYRMKNENPLFWVTFTKIRKYNSKLFQIHIFSIEKVSIFKSQTWKQLFDILRGVPYQFKGWKALVRINGNHLSASLSRCNHHNRDFCIQNFWSHICQHFSFILLVKLMWKSMLTNDICYFCTNLRLRYFWCLTDFKVEVLSS